MSDKEFTPEEKNAWFNGVPAGVQMVRHIDVIKRLAYATVLCRDEAEQIMNQVSAQGKMTNLTANQLMVANVPVYDWLARSLKLGTDKDGLNKAGAAVARGEVTYQRLVSSLDTFLPVVGEAALTRSVNVEPNFEGHETGQSRADLIHRFSFHPASTAEKVAAHGSVRELCGNLAHKLDQKLPPGREKALAMTHLEDAMMWANAALAREK